MISRHPSGSLDDSEALTCLLHPSALEGLGARDVLPFVTPTPQVPRPFQDREIMKREIAQHMKNIMEILGLDLTDDSLCETPNRIARMYVDEIFRGLFPENFPKVTVVENKMAYDQMLVEVNITYDSTCEHHFLPILGRAHIAYVCKGWVLGLSKFNRIVDFFAKRPQVQERSTVQIQEALVHLLRTEDVAVVVDGMHTCVRTRGVRDAGSVTRTTRLGGVFHRDPEMRREFFQNIPAPADLRL